MATNHRSSMSEMSETFQASSSIQLRTHPTHATINFSELGKKLLESARNGDTEEVIELINTGAPFTTDWLGASPLHYAAQYGHVETVETLLRSGIAKDARTKIDRTALHVASQEGFLDTVNVLLNYGCDVDAKDMLKMTPLHWAVQRGHRAIMEVLLNHGADVKIINKFDKTPIDIAQSSGYGDFVPLLQNFRGKAKPKVTPVDASQPIRVMKTHQKSRSKSQNINRNLNKISQIKQEIEDEDMNVKIDNTIHKNSKKDNISNGQILQYNKQANENKFQQQNSSISNNNNNNPNIKANQKLYTINPQSSNIVLLSNNNSTGSGKDSGNGPIKVKKGQVFTEIKNTKNIQPLFFNNKQGATPVCVTKRIIISDSNNSLQGKDEEIKKLRDENNKLKKEIEEYKSLIISKDLEIEKLKKQVE